MAQGTYRGTYETGDPRAAAQAKAMGATIGGDGWWYKDGRKLSHKEADALANSTGTAVDNAHQQWGTGGLVDRNRNFVGNALKNVAPIAGVLTGGVGGVLLGGLGAAAGAGIRKGTNIGNIAKTGVENAMLTSGGQNLAASFGYNGPMSAVSQAAKAAPTRLAMAPAARLAGMGSGPGVSSLGQAPPLSLASPSSTSGTDMGFFGKLGKGLKGMFTGGDANKKSPWENALAVGQGAYDAYSGYKKDRAAEASDRRMGDYYNRAGDQREAESLRNYGLDAAKEARDARIQSLSEEDRKRILMIMQNRDEELSPVREQLMKAIMGGDSTLFGGSVMKGLGSKGYI